MQFFIQYLTKLIKYQQSNYLIGGVGGMLMSLASMGLAVAAQASAPTSFEQDRQAILAMLGEYEVAFKFIESVPLSKDYQRKPDKLSGAYEKVILVEDTPQKIVLQHLLISKEDQQVIKHWRQDWHYEAKQRLEFTEEQTWRLKPIVQEKIVRHWTQCVYEVSDAPRYCGTGLWNHHYGNLTWTSDRTWRPLPRREYTTRSDYNALNVENRHTITPAGWTHEQDNTKVVRNGETTQKTIVREFGFNDYRKIQSVDFKPVDTYWSNTKPFWAEIRQRWESAANRSGCMQLKFGLNDMGLITTLFDAAEQFATSKKIDANNLDQAYTKWVSDCQSIPSR